MWACYLLVKNFGVAIILFTVIIRLITLPLNIKQQKDMAKSSVFAPKVQEIQTKYKNNQEKMQEELSKLQKQGYNPTGGCLPSIITMLILFGVIDVVYRPMTHLEHIPTTEIQAIVEDAYNVETAKLFENPSFTAAATEINEWYMNQDGHVTANVVVDGTITNEEVKYYKAVSQAIVVNQNTKDVAKIWDSITTKPDVSAMTDEQKKDEEARVKTAADFKSQYTSLQGNFGSYNKEGTFEQKGNYGELRALIAYKSDGALFTAVSDENKPKLETLNENMNFLGLDLGETPTFEFNWLLIIPILSLLLSLIQTVLSNKLNEKTNPQTADQMKSMKMVMYTMPLMSLFIAFTVPAGVGFYWAVSYAVGILQTIVLHKLINPVKLREEMAEKHKAALEEKVEIQKKTLPPKYLDKKGNPLPQKEIDRLRLAEARKKDAEKYGEEYKEED